MKKLFAGILTAALLAGAAAGVTACNGGSGEDLEVYAPDGAPALALAYAIAQEEQKEDELFDFDIVDANAIQTYVTGARPEADIAILPVNLASKILGTGTVYQMLGTVTNGNLYFLTTGDNPVLTKENLKETLTGKKVGVVQLPNVPGLTLQAVLQAEGVAYQTIANAQAEGDAEKVNLVAFAPDNVVPSGGCDYYLCPEPAASAKIKGTAAAPVPFKDGGDLQAVYGEADGYPQAVAVAKKTVIEKRAADLAVFIGYLEGGAAYLQSETTGIPQILRLLDEERESGLTPSFSAANLTKQVIARCSVKFTASKDCKEKVVSFLDRLMAVKADSAAAPADAFFYMG